MLNFLYPILDSISEGPFVRVVLKHCLRVFAGLMALVGLIALIAILKVSFSQGVPTSVSIAGLMMGALFVAATACQVQIFLYRAAKIEALPAVRYAVIPAASHLVRLAGEVMATSICTLGLAGFVVSVVAGEAGGMLEQVMPGPFGRISGSGFGGFVGLLFALALAFTVLVLFYLIAEGLQLIVDLADDVRDLASGEPALASGFRGSVSFGGVSSPEDRTCPSCRSAVPAGNAFCNMCGARVDKLASVATGAL